jgi:Spy/CpxP family protein refolding chaperone
MQRRLEKALDLVKATDSQRAAIKPIIQQLAADLKSIHKQHGQLHKAMLDAFAATTLDAAGIENLRVQASALLDQASSPCWSRRHCRPRHPCRQNPLKRKTRRNW